jgi:hypothetical protein
MMANSVSSSPTRLMKMNVGSSVTAPGIVIDVRSSTKVKFLPTKFSLAYAYPAESANSVPKAVTVQATIVLLARERRNRVSVSSSV